MENIRVKVDCTVLEWCFDPLEHQIISPTYPQESIFQAEKRCSTKSAEAGTELAVQESQFHTTVHKWSLWFPSNKRKRGDQWEKDNSKGFWCHCLQKKEWKHSNIQHMKGKLVRYPRKLFYLRVHPMTTMKCPMTNMRDRRIQWFSRSGIRQCIKKAHPKVE